MADVIELKPGEPVPDRKPSVVVGLAEDGGGMTADRSWTYFSYLPGVPGARERRIEEAKAYAEEQGMRRVYVLEASLAEHEAGADKSAVMPRKNEAETA